MKGIWKKDPQWESIEADYIVDDLAELLLFLNKEN
jgi:putative hydrolase of the HAD superfamily